MVIVFGRIDRAVPRESYADGQTRLHIRCKRIRHLDGSVFPARKQAAPVNGANPIEIGHKPVSGHNFDAVIAIVSDYQTSVACFSHAVRLIKLGSRGRCHVVSICREVPRAMKSSIGGNQTGGRVNEINTIAAGITGGNQSVMLHDNAL